MPPGWYVEPGTGYQRYWNGFAWAEYGPPAASPLAVVATQPPTAGTNGMAIASLVLGILWGYGVLSVLAIIFGAVGLKQTAERGQGGRGLAIAGLVLGIVGVIGAALLIALVAAVSQEPSYYEYGY